MTATFAELGLSAKVLAAIEAAGYPNPTPIQAEAIPVAVTGRDVLGIAQTGTGKTASFVLPMITRLESGRARARMPRSLILAPTRELAAQCAQSFEKYGVNHKLDVALLIGGVSMDDQVKKLDRGVDVLIATPGRLLDHFGRGRIMLMGVEILVIDEADRMLDMGFIPDIEKICKLLPPKRQTLFFSATMPAEITRLVNQFLKDPVRIEVAKPATAAATITQRFKFCPSGEDWAKREVLRELIGSLEVKNAIIFCNRKRDVAILLKSLLKHGFNAGALHGDMDQSSRTATLDKFRAGEIALLAASDVAARGLDIPDVSHIINYDVPWQPDDYVHRIGRTGRAGKEGFSATIVTPDDVKSIEAIAKLIGEETKWIGETPDAETLAEGRSRRGRGRGRPVRRDSASGPPRRGEGRGRGANRVERGRIESGRGDESRAEPRGEARPAESPRNQPERRPDREFPRREVRHEAPLESRPPEARPEAMDDRAASRHSAPARGRRPRSAEVPQPELRDDRPQIRGERAPRREARPDPRPQLGGRSRGAPPASNEPVASPEPQSRRPERERPARGEPRERAPERRDHREGRDTRASGGGGTPLGLGDHVPAFLRRPVRQSAD